jgi:hypothetical protein
MQNNLPYLHRQRRNRKCIRQNIQRQGFLEKVVSGLLINYFIFVIFEFNFNQFFIVEK